MMFKSTTTWNSKANQFFVDGNGDFQPFPMEGFGFIIQLIANHKELVSLGVPGIRVWRNHGLFLGFGASARSIFSNLPRFGLDTPPKSPNFLRLVPKMDESSPIYIYKLYMDMAHVRENPPPKF